MSTNALLLHHTYYPTLHQDEMKFIAFFKFAFLAIVGATTVHPSKNTICGTYENPISQCGVNNVDYIINGAKIDYNGQMDIFYNEKYIVQVSVLLCKRAQIATRYL